MLTQWERNSTIGMPNMHQNGLRYRSAYCKRHERDGGHFVRAEICKKCIMRAKFSTIRFLSVRAFG